MKLVRTVGLCLMVVFALSAMTASSAPAADLLAQVAGGGSIVGVTFLSLGLLVRLTKHNGEEIHCEHFHDFGLFLTSTLGNILILFLSCTAVVLGSQKKCNTPGFPSGQIHLPLSTLFHLGLAHLTSSTGRLPAVAILLPSGGISIECTAFGKIKVLGAVIGALQTAAGAPLPLNTSFSSWILSFQQTANGLQHLRLILMPGGALTSYDLHTTLNGGAAELFAENRSTSLHLFRRPNSEHVELELVEP